MDYDKRFRAFLIKHQDFKEGKLVEVNRDYIVYKKLAGAIAQLLIPKGTRIYIPPRYTDTHRGFNHKVDIKLRAERAVCLFIIPFKRQDFPIFSKKIREVIYLKLYSATYHSLFKCEFNYTVGKLIYPRRFSERRASCESGIHFFISLKAAEHY